MMMNKQEVIELLKSQKITMPLSEKDKKFNTATDNAITVIEQIEEHEKPVLNKEEAEWLDNLTNFFDTPDALYYITRCGYGDGFIFDFWGDTYELPLEEGIGYGELCVIRERLINAVLYGYTVKKEKLFTVEIPNPNGDGYTKTYLAKNDEGKVELYTWSDYTSIEFADGWKQEENAQLTEEEIREDHNWAWKAKLAIEVKE